MTAKTDLRKTIVELEQRLSKLDQERNEITERLSQLKALCAVQTSALTNTAPVPSVTMAASTAAKIALFRSLFRGREDVFPRRWDNAKTAKSGYSPVCRNEWVRGVCSKPQVKCSECPNQAFQPVTDEIIRAHLQGRLGTADFTAGVYPMLSDETCWFLAADFDKCSWQGDIAAFSETARSESVPVAVERSRSGNGGYRLRLL